MQRPPAKAKAPTPEFWSWLHLLAIFAVVLLPTWLLVPLGIGAVLLPLWLCR